MIRSKRYVSFSLLVIGFVAGVAACTGSALDDSAHRWDSWLGTSKDERVRELGIPTRCHAFRSGGEVCEWPLRAGPDTVDTMSLTFDVRGVACQWAYRGFYGERRSQGTCL